MKNLSIIYWSGTGNTRKMAEAVAEGAKQEGINVRVLAVAEASKEDVLAADAVALGCPSMGCEVLEETEMEPFVESLESENLSGKPVVLFGSFDWGDGQWMQDWAVRMEKMGARLLAEGLTVQNTPDEEGFALCRELGAKLASV